MRNYQKLDAWKPAMQLIKRIYLLTKSFPKEEIYGLTSQTKRKAVSVPSTIAKGMGRQYKKDTIQFLYPSRGPVYELETLLKSTLMVEVSNEKEFQRLIPLPDDTIRPLNGLINYTEKADLK